MQSASFQYWYLPVVMAAVLSVAGCNETFEPLQENDRFFFSIYGYLDASADTQWVRVTPLHESLFPGTEVSESLDAEVTLTHQESGEMTVMNDSLFSFGQNNVIAYNFWTTMDLQPEQTYLLHAERQDGRSSSVTVTLPEDFPTPEIIIPEDRFDEENPDSLSPDSLIIENVERLADVQAIYHAREMSSGRTQVSYIPHLKDTIRASPADIKYRLAFQPREDLDQVEMNLENRLSRGGEFDIEDFELFNCQMYVASASSDYPEFHILSEHEIALPEGISNVENGVGYLAGIVSKTFAYPTHPWPKEQGLNPDPCPAF